MIYTSMYNDVIALPYLICWARVGDLYAFSKFNPERMPQIDRLIFQGGYTISFVGARMSRGAASLVASSRIVLCMCCIQKQCIINALNESIIKILSKLLVDVRTLNNISCIYQKVKSLEYWRDFLHCTRSTLTTALT